MSFLEAAERVLVEANEPLHYREITRRAMQRGWLETDGQTPWASMNAQLAVAINSQGDACTFIRISPGIFGLQEWVTAGRVEIAVAAGQSLVPHYPVYSETGPVISILAGHSPSEITSMRAVINDLRGTPSEQVEWSDPDHWISERLDDEAQVLARKIWEGSDRVVNPRYTAGHWYLIKNYGLLREEADGTLQIGERGKSFLDEADGEVVQEIDHSQGLAKLMALVADMNTASRADLFDPWKEYLLDETNIRADNAASNTLGARLKNLVSRGLLSKTGRLYQISHEGLEYLQKLGGGLVAEPDSDHQLRKLLRDQQQQIRESIGALLSDMNPYAFEHLIKQLLESLGYDNVIVTSPSNDGGVDVVGDMEMGITSVREVVQVKRHQANTQRPALDRLRGSLHRFNAVRGTIISTGGFSKGAIDASVEPGAAPITLIGGNKLIDLLIENEIGVKKRQLEAWELDPEAFSDALIESDE